MLRFIDLRYQGADGRFAFYWTSDGCFLDLGGTQTWDTWDEFEGFYRENRNEPHSENTASRLARYKNVCPDWVFHSPTEEESILDIDGCEAYLQIGERRFPVSVPENVLALHRSPYIRERIRRDIPR